MKLLSARFLLVMGAFPCVPTLAFGQVATGTVEGVLSTQNDSSSSNKSTEVTTGGVQEVVPPEPPTSSPVTKGEASGDELDQNKTPPAPKPAKKPVFNTGFLRGTGAANIDLNDLLNSGVLPGVYDVSIVLNGRLVSTKTLSFEKNNRTGAVEACLSVELLDQLGVDVRRLYKQGFLDENASPACIDLEAIIDKASQSYDSERFRLSISIPQLYIKENAQTFADASLWDCGVTAAMTQYSATFNQNWNFKQSTSSYSAVSSLRNRINVLGWRIHNAGALTVHSQGGMEYSSFTLYAEHDVDFLKAQLRVGDVYASAHGLDGFGIRGAQLSDDLGMQPNVQRNLRASVRGLAETSATVEVRQRGFLILTTNVPPGAFELTDIPNVSSDGDLEVTVIEADGRRLVTIQPWVSGVEILNPGFFTYEAAAGQYNSYGVASVRRVQAVSLDYSYGLSRHISLHGGVQNTEGYYAKALSLATATPIGPVSLDLRYFNSTVQGKTTTGEGIGVSYSKYFSDYGIAFNASTQRFSASGFRSLSEHVALLEANEYTEPANPLKQTISLNFNKSWENSRWGTFFGSWVQSSFRNQSDKISSLNVGYRNSYRDISFSVTGTYTKNLVVAGQPAENARQLMFNVSIPLGTEKYPIRVNAAYATGSGFSSSQSISKRGDFSLDGQRFNYSAYLNGTHKSLDSAGANISTTTSSANYFASLSGSSSFASINLGASGGIVLHAGGINFTRNAVDTLALVKIPGQRGVEVRGSETGYNGYAVIGVSPYAFNQILIGKNLDPTIDLTQDMGIVVVPRRDAIVAARFEVVKGRRVEFKINNESGERLPFGAVLIDNEGKRMGVTDPFGRALVLLKQDVGTIQVKWDKKSCHFDYALAKAETALNFERVDAVCVSE